MKILGIETSCDETAAAVVEDGTKIVSSVVASSQQVHAKYGGIIPERAAREQLLSMIPVIKEALQELAVHITTSPSIDAIAVTIGPGLIGSLLIGVETAKALAFAWNKPLIPVNHLIGHIYANWLRTKNYELPTLPAIVLLVSGGHTELILMKDHGRFEFLGGTRDDAAGECFDKCARILSLGYPGGPAIEAAASQVKSPALPASTRGEPADGQKSKVKSFLPRPMINDKSLDFSFSGLKTAVSNIVNSSPNSLPPTPNSIAFELQEAVTDVLVKKTLNAAEKYQVKNILLAGGVAANKRLREKLPQALVPPFNLCTDNAAYIASAAYFNHNMADWQKVDADPTLTIDKS